MKLQLVGCSHHHAPVEVRERLAFSAAQVSLALKGIRERFPDTEAVLLSTCNRVELYTASVDAGRAPSHQDVAEFLASFHGLSLFDVFDDLFERTGEDAVRHLFAVAASLDSMVVGEPQILSQVKQAYELALKQASTGPLTNAIFQAALHTAKRVATETSINERRVSIPSVAVSDFARGVFERFDDKKVLVIGAGEMGEETVRYLRDEGAREITIVNRTFQAAQELAERLDGRAQPWDRLPALLAAADLVVSTTGAERPIVTPESFRPVAAARGQRPLFIIDLGVPRDFHPAVGDFLDVYLTSLDDLKQACERNRAERRREWPAAERIIEEETVRFMADLHHKATGPTIRRLKESCDALKRDEVDRLFARLPELDDRTRGEITQAFERFVNKMLHPPLESLRDEARHGTPHWLIEALKRLFQLRD